PVTDVDAALADLGIVFGATAGGFVLAAVVTPPAVRRLGLRRWMIVCLMAAAVVQLLPGAIYLHWFLVAAAALSGILAQSIKISVDTLVQVHVDDAHKGRTFTFYDMIFNVCLVLGAVLCALVMPPDGRSVAVLAGVSTCYLLTAVVFTVVTRRMPRARFDEAGHVDSRSQ